MDVISKALRETPTGWVLLGERHRVTGQLRYPAMGADEEWESVELSGEGELFTFSTVRMPVAGFEPPLDVGYVRLPEGLLVFAPLTVPEGTTPRIGQRARLRIGPAGAGDDPERLIYRFELIGGTHEGRRRARGRAEPIRKATHGDGG
jgi:uncharacterized OB-fold protein